MTEFRDHSDDELPPGRPLQRRAATNSAVPHEGAAGRLAARRLERIAGDADLITELQLTNFDTSTPEWRSFAEALAEYGYAVFKGWLILGKARLIVSQHANGQGLLVTNVS